MLKLKDEELLYMLEMQLPEMLERSPELEPRAFRALIKVFATKEETAAILTEMREFHGEFLHFRTQVEDRFDQVDRRFDQVDQRFDEMSRAMADLRDWVEVNVGGLQRRSGRKLEDVVAGALRVALERPDIRPEQLRLRQKMVDETGIIGLPGQKRPFEVDILAQDGQITVFEVKSYCEWEDIDRLADKVRFIARENPDVKVEGIMIAMSIGDDVRERCAELGITLVYRGD